MSYASKVVDWAEQEFSLAVHRQTATRTKWWQWRLRRKLAEEVAITYRMLDQAVKESHG